MDTMTASSHMYLEGMDAPEVWFAADLHLGHATIHRHRTQFESAEQHDQMVKANYLSRVMPWDTIYLLGDICFTPEALADFATWPGRKILIMGNHDSEKVNMSALATVYAEVHSLLKYSSGAGGTRFLMSHAPVHPDELRGRVNVHGHMHGRLIDDPRYINVSLEHTCMRPLRISKLRRRLHKAYAAMKGVTV